MGELTYGIERLAMFLQNKDRVYDLVGLMVRAVRLLMVIYFLKMNSKCLPIILSMPM